MEYITTKYKIAIIVAITTLLLYHRIIRRIIKKGKRKGYEGNRI